MQIAKLVCLFIVGFFSLAVLRKITEQSKIFAFIGLVADEKETEIQKIEPAKVFKR